MLEIELGFLIEQRVHGGVVNHLTGPTTNATPLDTYLARIAAIRAKLDRLRQLVDDHLGHAPDGIHWSHVGDLGRVEAGLNGLLAIFGGNGSIEALPANPRDGTRGNRTRVGLRQM